MDRRKLTNEEISNVCRETSLLISSGVMTADALSMLAEDETEPAVKEMLKQAADSMDDGCTLHAALQETKQLPDYVCSLLDVGEQSGRLVETLNALSDYYEGRVRMETRLRSALTYPAVLMLIMLIVIVVLLTKVLPVFNQVYSELGSSLTGVAGGLLKMGNVLNGIMPLICALIAVAALGLAAFSALPGFRDFVYSVWKKHFGDHGISRRLSEARFAEGFALGYSSGLQVEEAVSLAAALLQDAPAAKKRCDDCLAKLDEGMELSKAMSASGVIPQTECRLLDLGIRSGAGDQTMNQIAERLSDRADSAVDERIGQVEPALVICSSVMVGIILLSVMLPLMNIMAAIG